MLIWPRAKDPLETLDYFFDWSRSIEPPLPGTTVSQESIVSCVAAVTSGTCMIASQELVGALLQMFVTGGVAGEVTTITCTLVTSRGRTMEATGTLRVKER